jgi:predicted transcriptional regulator
MSMVPMAKDPPRISVRVTREEFDKLSQLAHQHKTSTSALLQMALRHLLVQSRSGALPMVARSTLENAIPIDCLGEPLV